MKTKIVECSYCKRNLERHNWQIEKFKNHFCNLNCKTEWQKTNLCNEGNPFYNKKHTDKAKEEMSKIRIESGLSKGENNPRFNVSLSNETKEKIRQKAKDRFANGFQSIFTIGNTYWKNSLNKIPKKNTSIEVKIQNFLKQLGIEYFTHQKIVGMGRYECDILIPLMNMVIECDGDRWHKYPIGKEIDNTRTKELIEKGFKVLRLWECEIKQMNLETFRELLSKELN